MASVRVSEVKHSSKYSWEHSSEHYVYVLKNKKKGGKKHKGEEKKNPKPVFYYPDIMSNDFGFFWQTSLKNQTKKTAIKLYLFENITMAHMPSPCKTGGKWKGLMSNSKLFAFSLRGSTEMLTFNGEQWGEKIRMHLMWQILSINEDQTSVVKQTP